MEAYTLKRHKSTNEIHIFKGVMTRENCNSSFKSICRAMDENDSAGNSSACNTEQEARDICASLGRQLYSNK